MCSLRYMVSLTTRRILQYAIPIPQQPSNCRQLVISIKLKIKIFHYSEWMYVVKTMATSDGYKNSLSL